MTSSATSTSANSPRTCSRRARRTEHPAARAAFLITILFLAGACAGSPGRSYSRRDQSLAPAADPAFVAAGDLERAGKREEAREAFRALRSTRVDHLEAWYREIQLSNEPAAARTVAADLDLVIAAQTSDARRADYLALRALLESKEVDREAKLNEALALDEDAALPALFLADLLTSRGDDEEAFEFYRRAAESERTLPRAIQRYAIALIGRHEYDKAIAEFQDYLTIVEDDAAAHYNLGTLLLNERRDAAGAWDHLSRAAELAPEDVDILVNAAAAGMAKGRNEEALSLLTRAKRLDPQNPDTFFNLAVFYADHAGDPDAAIINFETYLQLGGEDKLRVGRWIEELKKKAAKE